MYCATRTGSLKFFFFPSGRVGDTTGHRMIRSWNDTLSSLFRKTHCKFYIAIIAYWYHLFPNDQYTEEQRVNSLYCICHGHYEELSENPVPRWDILSTKPKMHYQIEFLNFYKFRPSAADRLLDLHASLGSPSGDIADKVIKMSFCLCVAFYLKGKHINQDTQDLLCLALMLRSICCIFPEFEDEDIWCLLSKILRDDHHYFRNLYINENAEWLLNDEQLGCIFKYFFRLDAINMRKEMAGWPIVDMMPVDMKIPILPLKPKGCCKIHGHSFHQEKLCELQYECNKLKHGANNIHVCKKGCRQLAIREAECLVMNWKDCSMCFETKCWSKACEKCRTPFIQLEDRCLEKHNSRKPEVCKHGCSQQYTVLLYRMKGCKNCKYI